MRSMHQYVFGLLKTLKGFVFVATVGVAALVFLGATLASSLLYEKLLEERSLDISREVAQQNFNAIFQILRKGGSQQDVDELGAQNIRISSSMLDKIELYRNDSVVAAYGRHQQVPMPAEIVQAMGSATQSIQKTASHVRYLYPIIAQKACLQCHAYAREGDVLGVIAIQHKLLGVTTTVRIYYVLLFLTLGLLVLMMGVGLANFVADKLNRSVDLFRRNVDSFNSIKDFSHLNISKVDYGFEELNQA